ncbi:MAG: hypothetical protein GQ533_10240 [Methanosarcinaceae archaeon]|nr:hypothetical protein [Methanosarcinaceae archaeon]
MPGEDTPAQHKSSETVIDADVQCLLNIALAGASVVEGLTSEHDDASDVLESALPLLRSSAQVGGLGCNYCVGNFRPPQLGIFTQPLTHQENGNFGQDKQD